MKFLFFRKRDNQYPALYSFINTSLGFKPGDMDLYVQAFRHKSVTKKFAKGTQGSNERLEFLGDAVISSIVSQYLYDFYPEEGEGFLTKMRSKIVNRTNLNFLGEKLNLEEHIHYLKGPTKHKSLVGNVFEALFGAIYLDKGYQHTKNVLIKLVIEKYIDLEDLEKTTTDFKSELLILCQKSKKKLEFRLLKEEVIHSVIYFTIGIYIDNEHKATAMESSKRKAEQHAAKITLKEFS